MKTNVCIALLIVVISHLSGYAQSKRSTSIPFDAACLHGKLENGLTYYIRKLKSPDSKVHLSLVVKAGREQEAPDQLEYAHLLEHMAFIDTRHFKNVKVTCSSWGLKFGNDFNAGTGEKVTNYNLDIPSGNPALFANALQLLRDWAQDGIELDSLKVANERNVVLQELKGSGYSSGGLKMREYLSQVIGPSPYTDHMLKDTRPNLINGSVEALSKFYHDWYRPDLQAVIIVGDIDPEKALQQVRSLFSGMVMPADAKQIDKPVPAVLTGSNRVIILEQLNRDEVECDIVYKYPFDTVNTVESLKASLVKQLCGQMINARFRELKLSPYVDHQPIFSGTGHPFAASYIHLTSSVEKFRDDFIATISEIERMKKFGFTRKEWAKARKENKAINIGVQYTQHFVEGSVPLTDTVLINKMNAAITLQDVNACVSGWTGERNRYTFVRWVEKNEATLPDSAMLETWMAAAKKKKLLPYRDPVDEKLHFQPLMSKMQVSKLRSPAQAVQSETIPEIGVTQLQLPNGLHILLKPNQDNSPGLLMVKKGGTGQYTGEDFLHAHALTRALYRGGLGMYNKAQLDKYMAASGISANLFMEDTETGIRAEAKSTANLESALQAVYLYFTQPGKDTACFTEMRTNGGKDHAKDTARYRLDRSRLQTIRIEQWAVVSAEKSYRILEEQFSNAGEFVCVITGNFKPEQIKPLLLKYLGALPGRPTKVAPSVSSFSFAQFGGQIEQNIYKESKEEQAYVQMIFRHQLPYNPKNVVLTDVLGKLMQSLATQRFREIEGLSYVTTGHSWMFKDYGGNMYAAMAGDCPAKSINRLFSAGWDELNKLKEQGIPQPILDNAKAAVKSELQDNISNKSSYWQEYLAAQYLNGRNYRDILHYPAMVDSITSQTIRELAKEVFTNDNYRQMAALPESYR